MLRKISLADTILRALVLLFSAFAVSCESDRFDQLSFVGDSLIARWDLQASFPNTITRNYGVGGSGVVYLESKAGCFDGADLVVLSGTNDIAAAIRSEGWPDDYLSRYLAAIKALGARHVYLFSILPRGSNFNGELYNPQIQRFNNRVKEVTKTDPQITHIDVYDSLCRDGVLDMQYSFDGLHLNYLGYEILTEAIDR